MTMIVYSHPACLEHDPGPYHPERPDRLRAVLASLEEDAFASLEWRQAPRATIDQLVRVHDRDYVERLLAAVPEEGQVHLDPDTVLSAGSGEAALRAAGAACAAVEAVVGGEAQTAFLAVRPPGHHAEPRRAMGFCLFNNIAVAARHAQVALQVDRVAVIDFDVHHGNGTQAVFEVDPSLFYASTHQAPCYPGTGAEGERGVGNVINVGLAPGMGSHQFRRAYQTRILPELDRFAPGLILVSAGFDGHLRDPLAALRLTEDDYSWITSELVALAKAHCRGRIVSALEGGYDLSALASSVAAHVAALLAGQG